MPSAPARRGTDAVATAAPGVTEAVAWVRRALGAVARLATMELLMISQMAPVKTGQSAQQTRLWSLELQQKMWFANILQIIPL